MEVIMNLQDLIKARISVNESIDITSKLARDNPISWLKTVVGFANYKGGTLYVGACKDTLELIGFDKDDAEEERSYLVDLVQNCVYPKLQLKAELIAFEKDHRKLYFLKIVIKASNVKPVALQLNADAPHFYMRRSGYTSDATYLEIKNMFQNSVTLEFDQEDSKQVFDKTKFSKLFQLYKNNNSRNLTEKDLASIGYFNKDHKLKNGAIFFLDNYSSDKTQIICSVFPSISKCANTAIKSQKFKGNLIDLIGSAKEFIESRMNRSFIKLPDRRVDIDAYPNNSLFAAIIIAITNRDYSLPKTSIQLDMFQDRLEITSPGSFYLSNFNGTVYDLSKLISKRRNELICNILVRCKVMEAAGTGFDKIIEDYKDADLRHKPFARLDSDKFTLVLPDLTYEPGIENNSVNISYDKVSPSSKYDEQILAFCYLKEKSVLEIAEHIQVSNSTYLRDVILGNLCKNSLLTKSNRDNRSYYFTNGDKVRLL